MHSFTCQICVYIYIQRLCSIFSIITRFLRDKFLMIDIGYVGLESSVCFPSLEQAHNLVIPNGVHANPLCLHQSFFVSRGSNFRAHCPGIFKIPFFQDSRLALLLAIARTKCEKMRKAAADPLPAVSSWCQQRRRLQTFRYWCQPPPQWTPPTIPAALLRAYLPPASIKCI